MQVNPLTGEADDDGVEGEYQLDDFEVLAADYMLKVGASDFKSAWEIMGPEAERIDEYGLGARKSLAGAVSAVISILGMQACEGTEAVPLSGVFMASKKVLVRLSFGIIDDGRKQVAMKLAVRSEENQRHDS